MVRRGAAIVLLGTSSLFAQAVVQPSRPTQHRVHIFQGLTGPAGVSIVPEERPASWLKYAKGSKSRLAILLADTNSYWQGLTYGLKAIGVPFCITQDYREALNHRVVLVYPLLSGASLTSEALASLAAFPTSGGTLIAINDVGRGFDQVFGFSVATPSRRRYEIRFNRSHRLTLSLTDPRELAIRLTDTERTKQLIGTYGYSEPIQAPIAMFDDGAAAIIEKTHGVGHAYLFGLDVGFLILRGYYGRLEGIERSYVNQFEPTVDVFLQLLKNIYQEASSDATTLAPVPFNKRLSVLITHDIDFSNSVTNSMAYADFEKTSRVPATYFIQAKYIKDFSDDIFLNDAMVPWLKKLLAMGMELASHSVCHSRSFSRFPIGTGSEQYPSYTPYVIGPDSATNATILGELRVSKFLLEKLLGGAEVISFRSGHLQNPFSLPQDLQATGYRFSSNVTANSCLTHLPFPLNYDRKRRSELDVFEFPVTIEDEELPRLDKRLSQAIQLVQKLSRYGGTCVVLIHPNVAAHKLSFEREFVAAVKDYAWFGTVAGFGRWWSTRHNIDLDIESSGDYKIVNLETPAHIEGLTLRIPQEWKFHSSNPPKFGVLQTNDKVVIPVAEGHIRLNFHRVNK